MKLLIYCFFSTILLGNSYPHFTKSDFISIENHSGIIAKNRAQDYQQTINTYKKFSQEKQLIQVNFYLNQLLPQYDDIMQKQEDYWASPKEFLVAGYGDCEDYVIIKYFTLIKLGFREDKLFLTTVYEKYIGGYHMVLSYFKTKGESPLILDNLSFRILPLNLRIDLEADIFINSSGNYKLDSNFKLIKMEETSMKFQELLKKTKNNN